MGKVVLLIALLLAVPCYAGNRLYQYSTIDALLNGLYDGQMSMEQLKKHGNFGIGTLAGLDGELIILDGVAYHAKAGGDVNIVNDDVTTPFATVSDFEKDFTFKLSGIKSLDELNVAIFDKLPTKNVFYAIRIDTEFDNVKTRAIPKQEPPYKKLAEVVGGQVIYELQGRGTLVGYYSPSFVKGVNVSGFHWHFINDARSYGGHVLDCSMKSSIEAKIDALRNFEMLLPDSNDFNLLNLNDDMSKDLHKVEK